MVTWLVSDSQGTERLMTPQGIPGRAKHHVDVNIDLNAGLSTNKMDVQTESAHENMDVNKDTHLDINTIYSDSEEFKKKTIQLGSQMTTVSPCICSFDCFCNANAYYLNNPNIFIKKTKQKQRQCKL